MGLEEDPALVIHKEPACFFSETQSSDGQKMTCQLEILSSLPWKSSIQEMW